MRFQVQPVFQKEADGNVELRVSNYINVTAGAKEQAAVRLLLAVTLTNN